MPPNINPAFLITDESLDLLEKNSMYQISFQELTETSNPWEVDFNKFRSMQNELFQIETGLRRTYPQMDLACVITNSKYFWVEREVLEAYSAEMEKPLDEMRQGGLFPTWKMTSAELTGGHINNLRHLLMAVAHDQVMLVLLDQVLGRNKNLIQREFEMSEKYVQRLIEFITNFGPTIAIAMKDNFVMMERCRVTLEALERGEVEKDNLGYSLDDLTQVKEILDQRCRRELPAYMQNFDAIHQQITAAFREGESSQLSRLSRWELALALIGKVPDVFASQAKLYSFELARTKMIVQGREKSMGASESGQQALAMHDDAMEAKEANLRDFSQVESELAPVAAPVPESEPVAEPEPVMAETSEPTSEEEAKPKKEIKRMAFHSRRGR